MVEALELKSSESGFGLDDLKVLETHRISGQWYMYIEQKLYIVQCVHVLNKIVLKMPILKSV